MKTDITTTEKILMFLTDYPAACKAIRLGIYKTDHQEKTGKEIRGGTLRVTLSRLKKKGLLENKNGLWRTTGKGKDYIGNKRKKLQIFSRDKARNRKKDLVIIFDIPEDNRSKRDRLRDMLQMLDFKYLQKSVWIGPSPLPKEFIEYLNQNNILKFIKFFKVKEEDII